MLRLRRRYGAPGPSIGPIVWLPGGGRLVMMSCSGPGGCPDCAHRRRAVMRLVVEFPRPGTVTYGTFPVSLPAGTG
jgi:hypothetical protein